MHRRFLAVLLVLDGLCAVALPGLGAMLTIPVSAAETAFVEIAGTCVETLPVDDADLAGRTVPMDFCTG